MKQAGSTWHGWAVSLLLASVLVGLGWSRWVLSANSVLVVLLLPWVVGKQLIKGKTWRHPLVWPFALLLVLQLVDGLRTNELDRWGQLLALRVVLLAFALLWVGWQGQLPREVGRYLPVVYVALLLSMEGYSLWQYALNSEAQALAWAQGKSAATWGGRNAITVGLMLAHGTLWAAGLAWQRKSIWWVLAAGALALLLHVLGFRSGLLALYVGLLLGLLVVLKSWRQRGLALVVLVVLAVSLVQLPGAKARLAHARQDLAYYQAGRNLDDWSLGRRLAALEMSREMLAERPLTGHGYTSLRPAMQPYYDQARAERRLDISPKATVLPHNQLVSLWLGYGLLGLVAGLGLLLAPLWLRPRLGWAFWATWVVTAVSFVVDDPLDMQLPVAWLALWWALSCRAGVYLARHEPGGAETHST